jgi:REP element-mobilizing transposase RayT
VSSWLLPSPQAARLNFLVAVSFFITIIMFMAKLVGYMVTWTTHGSWLQGDDRRYVKGGKILDGDKQLYGLCIKQQKSQTVKLNTNEKNIVRNAILQEAKRINHKIERITVCSNHIHIAARDCERSIEQIVSMYKSIATRTLKKYGRTGKVWTKSFDKRFCFTEEDFSKKMRYIKNHK